MSLQAICRNCSNTGVGWQGNICPCSYGRAVQQVIERKRAAATCPDCGGSGLLGDGYVCKRCDGKGK